MLSDRTTTQEQVRIILSERDTLIQNFQNIPWIETLFPTDANFILMRVDDANLRYEQLKQKGIIVRNRTNQPLCENCLRITVGTPQENMKLINVFKTL